MRLELIPTVRQTSDMVGSEDEDVEMAGGEATSAAKKAERKADPKYGDEFKAEVCCIRTMGRYKTLMYVFILAESWR